MVLLPSGAPPPTLRGIEQCETEFLLARVVKKNVSHYLKVDFDLPATKKLLGMNIE
jgi:hypothetical protein